MHPLITLEEHYVSRKAIAATGAEEMYARFPTHVVSKLEDVSTSRLLDMDRGGVSIQVLSHGPLDASASVCASANDELAGACAGQGRRLAGFAMLPMKEGGVVAAAELRRCVESHGFVGALVDNHVDGQFYDDDSFWPVFEAAQALDVPVYIHPTFASAAHMAHYQGNYGDAVALALSAFGWGWHADTGLHILRLFAAGLFDRYPRLKIIIGHTGEMLPFQIERIFAQAARWGPWKRDLRTVWRENIWVTTSGMFALAPLACLLATTSIDHVLFSVDYPFSSNETGRKFVDEIESSGLLKDGDLEKFCYGNAEKLLGIKAVGNA